MAGVLLLPTRFRKAGLRLLVSSVLVTLAIWLLPIGSLLTLPLEDRFPPWTPAQGAPTGMIVLGGVINPSVSIAHGQVAINGSAERLTSALALAREYPNARIVFSGGNAALIGGRAEGGFALRFLKQLGIPSDRITIESKSRDTAENAINCKRLIAPKPGERWLLITSAMHMPRAVGAFREVGFPVVPYPVDYQVAGWPGCAACRHSRGCTRRTIAMHEWLGLFAYWLTRRIPVLLPGPSHG